MQFFISHLASWLCTRRFSEPTFDPPGPQIIEKHSDSRRFAPFRAPASSCFSLFLFSDLLTSWLLFPDSSHLCFSTSPYRPSMSHPFWATHMVGNSISISFNIHYSFIKILFSEGTLPSRLKEAKTRNVPSAESASALAEATQLQDRWNWDLGFVKNRMSLVFKTSDWLFTCKSSKYFPIVEIHQDGVMQMRYWNSWHLAQKFDQNDDPSAGLVYPKMIIYWSYTHKSPQFRWFMWVTSEHPMTPN